MTKSGLLDGTTWDVAVSGMVLSGTVTANLAEGAALSFVTNVGSLPSTSTDNQVGYSTVAAVQIDDGAAQRSMVRSIRLTFNQAVAAADLPAFLARFSLVRGGDGLAVGLAGTLDAAGTTLTLRFTGASVIGGSLADGRYELRCGGTTVLQLHRLFGDLDGDADVDAADAAVMATVPNNARRGLSPLYNEYFDYNGNGIIATDDRSQFNLRVGITI